MGAVRGNRYGLRAHWASLMGRICCTVTMTAAIVVAGLATAPPSMSVTTGLVAAYGFDEGSGTTVTDASGNGNTGTISNSTNPLQIGGDSIYGQNFAGLIDEVRVYNVALTAAQIQTDMATPVNPAPTPAGPSELVAAFGF